MNDIYVYKVRMHPNGVPDAITTHLILTESHDRAIEVAHGTYGMTREIVDCERVLAVHAFDPQTVDLLVSRLRRGRGEVQKP